MAFRRRLLPLLALPTLGCIEDRLSVDILTYVHADGSCTRRIEYRLERYDPDKGQSLRVPDAEDPLRLWHRFPRGDLWSLRDESSINSRIVTTEATLPSPNDIEWDYWRQLGPNAPAARNHVSFAMSGSDDAPLYEYAETFLDQASPLLGARLLAQIVGRREAAFADMAGQALGTLAPRRAEIRRAYKESLAQPFAREVEKLVARPVFGPRERKELEAVLDRVEKMLDDLGAALEKASPVAAPTEIRERLKPVLDDFGESVDKEFSASGLPRPFEGEQTGRIHFKAVLVMPAAVVRANACVQGDTVQWEFDQQDLYGRGFEMWARAGGR
jgi:hypothetical protein